MPNNSAFSRMTWEKTNEDLPLLRMLVDDLTEDESVKLHFIKCIRDACELNPRLVYRPDFETLVQFYGRVLITESLKYDTAV